ISPFGICLGFGISSLLKRFPNSLPEATLCWLQNLPLNMTLFILRHGLAVEPGTRDYPNDADRPLTAEGRSKLRQIAQAMKKLEVVFDVILWCHYELLRQMAECGADKLGESQEVAYSVWLLAGV